MLSFGYLCLSYNHNWSRWGYVPLTIRIPTEKSYYLYKTLTNTTTDVSRHFLWFWQLNINFTYSHVIHLIWVIFTTLFILFDLRFIISLQFPCYVKNLYHYSCIGDQWLCGIWNVKRNWTLITSVKYRNSFGGIYTCFYLLSISQ